MAKHKQKNSRATNNPVATTFNCPAVSVIIPMYNAEKYIGEALDSLLNQTFQDFEVIVVDDCSTDKSVAVVESYAPKFGERLFLTQMKKNSGGGGEPRNKGLSFSRGEYVFFVDADDALVRTALEDMYTLAKQFNADTVYCEKYFVSKGVGQEFMDNIRIPTERIQNIPAVDKPTFETNDMTERVSKAIKQHYWVTPWLRLVSRNLLITNDIKFPSLIGSNDVAWTFQVLFCSKKFLRIPNPCYIWRMHEESNTLRRRTFPEHIHKWMDRTIRSLRDMDDFMADIEFFRKNPAPRYAVIDHFIKIDFSCIFNACATESPVNVYQIFREKFGEYLGNHDVLVAALCTALNTQQKIYAVNQQKFNQFAAQAKARIAQLEAEVKRLKIKR